LIDGPAAAANAASGERAGLAKSVAASPVNARGTTPIGKVRFTAQRMEVAVTLMAPYSKSINRDRTRIEHPQKLRNGFG
jgi:hypothetical protein